eukprot:CAMPEP_0180793804 /NCGR_PEP_ID=MMETSP1038_2-20121128/55231_1 /TAXON_ID=632150 /ORGANISM="Azadinium spinosum, Strain 3D9" /LENGTH=55 /DNA_ID=CAMNT_0022832421 /DNA_START=139 /DNA_END=302 /DNA_ORIENTATION=+
MLYIGGLMCVMLIREDAESNYPGANKDVDMVVEKFNPYIFFSSVPDAMFTLFNMV